MSPSPSPAAGAEPDGRSDGRAGHSAGHSTGRSAGNPAGHHAKIALRRDALARRRSRSAADVDAARAAIAGHLRGRLAGAAVVGGYLPLPSEPLDPSLTTELLAAGVRVLLPVALVDAPLDWADAGGQVAAGAFGIAEPVGTLLGPDTIAAAEVVLVPALLVDARGVRLGRGGGHYDRTLPAVRGETIAVMFDDEVVDALPFDEFDVPVTAVVTPSGGVRRLGA